MPKRDFDKPLEGGKADLVFKDSRQARRSRMGASLVVSLLAPFPFLRCICGPLHLTDANAVWSDQVAAVGVASWPLLGGPAPCIPEINS